MRLFVFRIRIMDIVCHHQRNVQFFTHLHQGCVHGFLLRDSVVLQFQKIIILPETVLVFARRLLRLVHKPLYDITLHFPRKAGGKRNDSLMKLPQHFHIHPGPVIIALRKTTAYDFHQIGVSRIVFRQQHQMVITVFPAGQFLVKTGIGRNIYLTAHNRIDTCRFRFLIKINHAVHNAVVGDCGAVHPQFLNPLHIFLYLVGPVQQTVFRMHMQMGKCHAINFLSYSVSAVVSLSDTRSASFFPVTLPCRISLFLFYLFIPLFHGNYLCEVPRFIHIQPFIEGNIISQKLQCRRSRHHHKFIPHSGQLEHTVP